jgi:hypothetical protein
MALRQKDITLGVLRRFGLILSEFETLHFVLFLIRMSAFKIVRVLCTQTPSVRAKGYF